MAGPSPLIIVQRSGYDGPVTDLLVKALKVIDGNTIEAR